jgi:hypothetical protein
MVQPLRQRQTKGAATAMFYLMPPCHISTLPKLCEKSNALRMRRIGFSIALSRERLRVQLSFTLTKSRQNFYAQV